LPLGVLLKLLSKATLIYDTHELETEGAGSVGIKKVLYQSVERLMVQYSDLVITVNQSIANWYRKAYGLKAVIVVQNIPYRNLHPLEIQNNILKSKFGILETEVLYIFQGGLGPGRGIGLLLDVFSRVDPHKHIIFMGFGEWESRIKGFEARFPNIHFHEAVSPKEVITYTQCADIGLCIQENIGLNYYFSLPNKLFEYIMSGVPAIVSDFPEMARVVDEGGCGWKVMVDMNGLCKLINSISPEEITRKRNNAMKYRQTIGWQNEEKALIQAYRDLRQ